MSAAKPGIGAKRPMTIRKLYYYSDGAEAAFLVRNLCEATPDSSQSAGLVKANSPAISYNREKRRDSIEDLQNIAFDVRQAGLLGSDRNNRRTSTSLKPSLADCVATGAAVEAARLTAGMMV